MYIRLTRIDGRPIWLNASFVVTVEPTRSGGAIVVPIGDGLDYEVREKPEAVLAMLEGAPVPNVVPVPPPKTLAPQPEDVSPDDEAQPADVESSVAETTDGGMPTKKRGRRKGKSAQSGNGAAAGSAESDSAGSLSASAGLLEPEGFKEIVADLKARKCRTGKRLRNAIKSYFKKTDETEIDHIIEAMINGGYMLVGGDGHVTWIESPS